jgi:Tol biopolymer transport system component
VNGKTGLWVRPLDGVAAQLISGTENAGYAFWSPDSKSIAFVAGATTLYRVDVSGGTPLVICDPGPEFAGGSWGSDGYILFSKFTSGIFRVSASGGTPSRVTAVDSTRGEVVFRWPQVLPGGRFLYWAQTSKPESTGVYAASIAKAGEHVKLLTSETDAVYASRAVDGKGYLLWLRGGSLIAQEFDPRTLQFAAEPQQIADGLNPSLQGRTHVAASANGLLLYGSFGGAMLGWFDRTGKLLRELGEPVEAITDFRLSPDQRQIAVARSAAGIWDLWLMDAESGLTNRFTAGTGYYHPARSSDGQLILYSHIGSRKRSAQGGERKWRRTSGGPAA